MIFVSCLYMHACFATQWMCVELFILISCSVFAGVKAAPPYRPHLQLWHFVEEKKKTKKKTKKKKLKKKKKKRERKKKRTKENDRNFLVEHSFFFTNYTKFINILINQQEVNLKKWS